VANPNQSLTVFQPIASEDIFELVRDYNNFSYFVSITRTLREEVKGDAARGCCSLATFPLSPGVWRQYQCWEDDSFDFAMSCLEQEKDDLLPETGVYWIAR
jgi:hypothetical protein